MLARIQAIAEMISPRRRASRCSTTDMRVSSTVTCARLPGPLVRSPIDGVYFLLLVVSSDAGADAAGLGSVPPAEGLTDEDDVSLRLSAFSFSRPPSSNV